MSKIHLFVVRFMNEISQNEIAKFRGAVVSLLKDNNILFHNHTEEGLRYAYPLIQYKRINNRAAIICLEEGTESIGEFFTDLQGSIDIGNRAVALELDSVHANQILVQVWEERFNYSLRKWLPFNQENYEKYNQLSDYKEKIDMMEKILIGNILSFAKGMNIHFEKEIVCAITNIQPTGTRYHKGVRFASFDVMFATNVSLPNYIGLGKGVSHGFGMVMQLRNNDLEIRN